LTAAAGIPAISKGPAAIRTGGAAAGSATRERVCQPS
jgi:hypothetical protein